MTIAISVIILTASCFFAAILSLATSKADNGRIMGVCAAIAIAVGTVSYGYAYSLGNRLSVAVVAKTLLTVCRMFGGVNDFGAVSATPLFHNGVMIALFWVGHFLAFYLTASAAITLLGKRMMRFLRTRMLRHTSISLIYDASLDSIRLAGEKKRSRSFVLVTERSDPSISALADSLGGVEFPGGKALCSDEAFLKELGIRGIRRPLDVFCIGSDPNRNLRYAEALLPALQARDVSPDMTSLFLLGVPEDQGFSLQALDDRYGYGTVFACNQFELIARLIVEKCPPWGFMTFDGNARAQKDLRVFVVGFGQMGQAALKHLLINGQMEGSAFHAEVFDRRMDDLRGYIDACFPALLTSYDIALQSADADSVLFYDHLDKTPPDMIVLCAGNRKDNLELAQHLYRKYGERRDRPRIIQCTTDSAIVEDAEYTLGSIDVRDMDRTAMVLNHVYCNGPSAEEDWKRCDPFSRASCRASADFFPAFLCAAGVSREEALAGKWPPPPDTLENLARTEHLRWCAFHLAMGYAPMSDEEFSQRSEQYLRGEIRRIAKNTEASTHACLVPWEALDELSRRENSVTGGAVDYKAPDVNNVLALPEILRAAAGTALK